MAMRKRKPRQQSLFIGTDQLGPASGHPFYVKLNEVLAEAGFDEWVESRCEPYYEQEDRRGRPSIPPGVYFRMVFVGYFEGIDSQRGIAWRCADSLSLRQFLGVPLGESTPEHSSMTVIRQRLPSELFDEVFQFVLRIAATKKMVSGKSVGVDSTTLEASAAMKSIVRKDTGEDWNEYVTRLMRSEGAIGPKHEPTVEEIRTFDKSRPKKVSNAEWESPTDADARITKMKDGTTHLAYKAEHVVDLKSDLVLHAEVRHATDADSQTLTDSVLMAEGNLRHARCQTEVMEVTADKGYHAAKTLADCAEFDVRTYISEPKRAHRLKWTDKPVEHRAAVVANRRRMTRAKGKAMQRRRSEVVERSFAHICDSGGARRMHVRGLTNVNKRYVLAAAAHNLARIMRRLFGVGKPKGLQGDGAFAPRDLAWYELAQTTWIQPSALTTVWTRFFAPSARTTPMILAN